MITQPRGIFRLNADGTLNAHGWLDNAKWLRAVWGGIIPGIAATNPPNPWDSNVPNFVQGTFTFDQQTQRYEWQVNNIPGARGECKEDTFFVWYAFENEACLVMDASLFLGDSTGSGCGSGSGSGGGGGGGGAFPMGALFDSMAPRFYRMRPNPDLGSAAAPCGCLKSPAEILLQYDEANSTPIATAWISTPVRLAWRSMPAAPSERLWSLHVTAEGASLRRGDATGNGADGLEIWTCNPFQYMNRNRLVRATSPHTDAELDAPATVELEPLV